MGQGGDLARESNGCIYLLPRYRMLRIVSYFSDMTEVTDKLPCNVKLF